MHLILLLILNVCLEERHYQGLVGLCIISCFPCVRRHFQPKWKLWQLMKNHPEDSQLSLKVCVIVSYFGSSLILAMLNHHCFWFMHTANIVVYETIVQHEKVINDLLLSRIHLADPDKNACPQDQSTEQLIPVHWRQMSDGPGYQHFNLTDTSVVHVLTKGLYLINLRISYRTLRNMCQHKDKPMLEVKVTQQHSNYGNERDVITAVESMQCVEFWRQSVTLNKVITLEDDTALRVKIESKTCKYINWHFSSHLEVTYL